MNPPRQAVPPPPAVPDAQRWRDRGPRNRPLVMESYPPPTTPHTMPPMSMHPIYYPPYIPQYTMQSPPILPDQMMPMMHSQFHPPPPPPPAPQTFTPQFPVVASQPEPVVSSPPPPKVRKLPWLSVPGPFPKRKPRTKILVRTKRSTPPTIMETPSNLPQSTQPEQPEQPTVSEPPAQPEPEQHTQAEQPVLSEVEHATSTQTPSEVDSTHPTTPASVASAIMPVTTGKSTYAQGPPPVVPPVLPRKTPATKETKQQPPKSKAVEEIKLEETKSESAEPTTEKKEEGTIEATASASGTPAPAVTKPASPLPAPKSWADLVKVKAAANAKPLVPKVNGHTITANSSIGDVLAAFDIYNDAAAPYLQPRGLINTGNMCFMNAVLQMLVFCGPFYRFLRHVGTKVSHNFKGDTPLIDAMILFMREFRIQSGVVSSQKDADEFGEAFVPEYVYEVIRKLDRFSSMTRGHQQDAEEFLGFLLDGLHEEAVAALKLVQSQEAVKSPTSEDGNGWLEVGNKGRAASTRKTVVSESPITKIFGGNLRSEFKVPGSKPSVTLEPYQPLQLDIAPPQVTSIVDALKQMTKPETIHGDFGSRGNGTATKQVLIDTLPPVLILHLKRFQYDNTGGTQKIWKTIGYPLILEVPPEVLSPINRGKPKPKYRLTGVIYHHGKFATGGHYTADVLRQDGKSWIRLDDTKISKVSPLDVAVSLSPEQAKAIAAEQLSDDDDHLEGPWEHANGSNGTTPKVNGKAKKPVSAGSKDGKVAYILFYQRI